MVADHWANLVAGDGSLWTRGWSTTQAQYQRWVGCRLHVGIELETSSLVGDRFGRATAAYGRQGAFAIKASHDTEIQVLWDVSDPVRFVREVRRFFSACQMAEISTFGSVHVNIQQAEGLRTRWGYYHGDAACNAYGRRECKYGPSAFTATEFIANLLVCVSSFPSNMERARKLASYLDPVVGPLCILSPTNYANGLADWLEKMY